MKKAIGDSMDSRIKFVDNNGPQLISIFSIITLISGFIICSITHIFRPDINFDLNMWMIMFILGSGIGVIEMMLLYFVIQITKAKKTILT
jgi:hypothetical protein